MSYCLGTLLPQALTTNKMSAVSFSFRPEAIPAYAQAEFLSRFFQLVLDYQVLTEPVPEAPAASSLAQPSFDSEAPAEALPSAFRPVDGDEAEKPKKERKNPWAGLTEEQRTERLAAMKRGRELKKAEKRRLSADSLEAPAPPSLPEAVPAHKTLEEMTAFELFGVYSQLNGLPDPTEGSWAGLPAAFHGKANLLAEVRRLQAALAAVLGADGEGDGAASETSSKDKKAESLSASDAEAMMRDRLSLSSLTKEQMAERVAMMRKASRAAKKAAAPAPAPVVAEADGAASETSSKKLRKNPWADLTPEQKAERVAKMQAARKAKKEAAPSETAGVDGSA
jgi:hypothetical protein